MEQNNGAVKRFLSQYGYLPTLSAVPDGCRLRLPRPVLTDPYSPECEVRYEIAKTASGREQGEEGLYLHKSFDTDVEFVPLPSYAVRPYIALDAVLACDFVRVDPSLLQMFDASGAEVDRIEEVLPGEDDRREIVLFALLSHARQGYDPAGIRSLAEAHGVLDGFEACITLF